MCQTVHTRAPSCSIATHLLKELSHGKLCLQVTWCFGLHFLEKWNVWQGQCRAGCTNVVQMYTSSFLHNLQNLLSGGVPTYLPVSISNRAVPPLSRASKDRCALCTSFWFTQSYFRKKYRCSLLGLFVISVFHLSLSHLNRQQKTT